MNSQEFIIPEFFDPDKVAEIWRVPYQEHACAARNGLFATASL